MIYGQDFVALYLGFFRKVPQGFGRSALCRPKSVAYARQHVEAGTAGYKTLLRKSFVLGFWGWLKISSGVPSSRM